MFRSKLLIFLSSFVRVIKWEEFCFKRFIDGSGFLRVIDFKILFFLEEKVGKE